MTDNPYQPIDELLILAREEERKHREEERKQWTPGPFAVALRSMRTKKRIRQRDVADMSGVSRSQVAKIERGYRSPTRDVVDAMARALDASDRERSDLLHAAGFATEDDDNILSFRKLEPEIQKALLRMVDIVRGGYAQ